MGNITTARTKKLSADSMRDAADSMRDAADSMLNAGPGWYFDPEDEAIYRFWDGDRWTDHCSDQVVSLRSAS